MLASGRSLISAPQGGDITMAMIKPDPGTERYCNGGKSTITTDSGPGAVVPVGVAELGGFTVGQQVIVGYGGDNEEKTTITATSGTFGPGTVTVDLLYNHKPNELILTVIETAPFIPGTVKVLQSNGMGSFFALVRDKGSEGFVDTTQTPNPSVYSVDHTTGLVSVLLGGAPTLPVLLQADTMVDHPDIGSEDGSGFFRNAQVMSFTRREYPSVIRMTNLDPTTVGVIIEESRNNGKSFKMIGAFEIGGLGRKVFQLGSGTGVDIVRVRAGAHRTYIDGAGQVSQIASGSSGRVDIDFIHDTAYAGQ